MKHFKYGPDDCIIGVIESDPLPYTDPPSGVDDVEDDEEEEDEDDFVDEDEEEEEEEDKDE